MNEENTKKSPAELLEDPEAIKKKRPRGSRSTSTGRTTAKPATKTTKKAAPKAEQPAAPAPAPEQPAPQQETQNTALKVIAERFLEQQRAQREAEREAEMAAYIAMQEEEEISAKNVSAAAKEPQTPTMELGVSDTETHTLNGPFAPQIQKQKKAEADPNDTEDATAPGEAPKRRKPKKVVMQLPKNDPNAPKIQTMTLGEQVTLDPNGTTYSHAENTPVGAGELSLHNTKKDAEEKNLASVMNMVNEMETKIRDLMGKLEKLTDEIVKRDVRIADLETQLFQARTSIDTMYKPACQIVLNKKRYRKKLEKDLLDRLTREAK